MLGCHKRYFLMFASAFILAACTSTHVIYPRHGIAIDQMHADLQSGMAADQGRADHLHPVPKSITNALISPTTDVRPSFSTEHRFNVAADKVPAKTFLMGLVSGTSKNMVIHPEVSGEITIDLKNVTIDETLEAVRDAYGYEYRHTPYGYEVLPAKLETRLFNVNYLNVKRKGKSVMESTSGQISSQVTGYSTGSTATQAVTTTQPPPASGTTVDTRSETNFWRDLEISLKQIVSDKEGRSVVVNKQAGVVIVHAYTPELHQVARFLDRIQSSMGRQVILEAKILEVQLNDQYQAGIDWNVFGHVVLGDGGIGQTAFLPFDRTRLEDFNSIFTLRVNGQDFGTLIKLLQTQGNVQVLSSPRISTVNNQQAVIKVGQDQFFVTGVSTTNVVSGTSNAAYPTQDINLTPFFSGITLDVTPQISNNGEVILHIHPTVSQVTDQTKRIVLGSTGITSQENVYVLPLAQSTIRESDNIVRAKNCQVVVIGGLMQNDMREEIAGVPILSRLPVFGQFFRRTRQVSAKIELVILLRPIITNNRVWSSEMADADFTLGTMRRGFHAGGLSDVFGNEEEAMYREKEM